MEKRKKTLAESEEHKNHIMEAKQNISNETRIKMSKAKLGKKPWNYGLRKIKILVNG